jgi:hypothetical protein
VEKAIAVRFHIFKPHEQKYMFERFWRTRPWAFLDHWFVRPPKKAPHPDISLQGKSYYFVSESLSGRSSFVYTKK